MNSKRTLTRLMMFWITGLLLAPNLSSAQSCDSLFRGNSRPAMSSGPSFSKSEYGFIFGVYAPFYFPAVSQKADVPIAVYKDHVKVADRDFEVAGVKRVVTAPQYNMIFLLGDEPKVLQHDWRWGWKEAYFRKDVHDGQGLMVVLDVPFALGETAPSYTRVFQIVDNRPVELGELSYYEPPVPKSIWGAVKNRVRRAWAGPSPITKLRLNADRDKVEITWGAEGSDWFPIEKPTAMSADTFLGFGPEGGEHGHGALPN